MLYAALPSALLIGPRYVVPGLELILFIPLVLANPRRMSKQNRLLRRLSIALVLLIAVSNLAALVLLIRSLVTGQATAGGQLLGAAGQVWFTNVLVFALAFWELDRGGPVTRARVARPQLGNAAETARMAGSATMSGAYRAGGVGSSRSSQPVWACARPRSCPATLLP